MALEFLRNNRVLSSIIYTLARWRSQDILKKIQPHLPEIQHLQNPQKLHKKHTILDIGSGTCNVAELLLQQGHAVTALDIQNISFVKHIQPVLYDGTKMPFKDNSFDTALLLTVLHHTPNPEEILKQAKRVARSIIIIEDIYTTWFDKYLTYFFDSALNLEFFGHPHTNKTDAQWKHTFKRLGLKLKSAHYKRTLLVFKHATYHVMIAERPRVHRKNPKH